MKNFLSTCIMAILLIAGESLSHACSDWFSIYDESGKMFLPNQVAQKSLQPFYYTSWMKYYFPDGESESNVQDPLIDEWVRYADNAFTYSDAKMVIQSGSYDTLSNIYYHLEKKKPLSLNKTWKKNSMVNWMLATKDLEAIGYLMYATKVSAALSGNSEWEATHPNAATFEKLLKGVAQLGAVAKSSFAKERYSMLKARLLFQGGYPSSDLEFANGVQYQVWTATAVHALGYRAGAQYREQDYNGAAALYAKMFSEAEVPLFTVPQSFEWCFGSHNEDSTQSANINEVLRKCQNASEKSAVYVLTGLTAYNNGTENLEKAYQLYPAIKGLDMLVSREITKLETNYYSAIYNDADKLYAFDRPAYYNENEPSEASNIQIANQETSKLQKICTELGKDPKVQNPAFFQSANAYLSYLQRDFQKSYEYCKAAEAAKPNDQIKQMIALQRLLLQVAATRLIDAELEEKILPQLVAMEQMMKKSDLLQQAYRNFLLQKLGPAYFEQGDTLKAMVVNAKAGNLFGYNDQGAATAVQDYGAMQLLSIPQLYALQDYLAAPKQKAFDNWLRTSSPSLDSRGIPLYIVRKYVQQHQFSDAVGVLSKMKSDGKVEAAALFNPFVARINDTQEPKGEIKRMGYMSFLQKMDALQSKIKGGGTADENFDYATGLYSISYYGLSWNATQFYRSGTDNFAYGTSDRKNSFEQNQYYGVVEAMKYYNAALHASKDENFKAKCVYMLAKCYQKSCSTISNTSNFSREDQMAYKAYTQNGPYYQELRDNYKNSAFVKSASSQCTYLSQYLKLKK